MTYDGFISYSHAADDLLAPRLQSALQRFAKPWWKRRALRVFRDESSLSANPHLWSSITEALDTSEWFVLLLSPDAGESEWVNREVAYWVEHRDPNRIIPVLTDGEFGWDDDVTGDAAPEALSGVFAEEPRWVDLRFARGAEQLDLRDGRFADAVADVASALRGVAKDELAGEEVRQYRRTVQTAWAAGALLVVLAVAAVWAGMVAAGNAEEAREQAARADENAAEADAQRAAAVEQARIADLNAEEARAEAERADGTARRLIEFVIQPAGDGQANVELPLDPLPRSYIPSDLPLLAAAPGSIRLDFWQQFCRGGSCFREPTWVDEANGVRVPFPISQYPQFTADTAFHVRHGFVGLSETGARELLATGYRVRLLLKLEDVGDVPDFRSGETYQYEASGLVVGDDLSCGPQVFVGSEPCLAWVFDFPGGLPAGLYSAIVEWTAPCAAWFETDVCDSPARPLPLRYGDGFVFPIDEAYKQRFPTWNLLPEFPWDPWDFAEPIPEPSG